MKFYNRNSEFKVLDTLFAQTTNRAVMTVLTGRRRVGKTRLIRHFALGKNYLYLFISKKNEPLLCEELVQEIKRYSNFPVMGDIRTFQDVMKLLFEISKQEQLIVIIDEFQELRNINRAAFSELQHLWDINKDICRMHLILTGSVYSIMKKIFQNSKEPLFGRADRIIFLKPLRIDTIVEILQDHNAESPSAIFDYYVITGGMPKYLEILVSHSAFDLNAAIDLMMQENSPFLDEGKHLLIEEFGKEYGTYFSVLELIASGKTGRSEIESYLQKKIGGYLDRLEKDYSIIASVKPINSKPNARRQKYRIRDNFLNFWFRFIYRYRSAIEIGNYNYVKAIINRDYRSYSGRILEIYFQELIAAAGNYNRIGSYWERNNANEIDIVAINETEKKLLIADVKLNSVNIDLEKLENKAEKLLASYPGFDVKYKGFSLESIVDFVSALSR